MKMTPRAVGLLLGSILLAVTFASPVFAQDGAKNAAKTDPKDSTKAAVKDAAGDAKAGDKVEAIAPEADVTKAEGPKKDDESVISAKRKAKERKARGDNRNVRAEMLRMKKRLEELEARLDSQGKKQEELGRITSEITEDDDSNDFRVYWAGKLIAESKKSGFKIKLGGRVHAEAGFFDHRRTIERRVGRIEDGFEMRRVRISLSGTLMKHVEYRTQYEFTRGTSSFRDIYVGLKDIPYLGTIRFGQQKEPFGLEQMSSTNDTPFIERGSTANLHTQRNTGVRILNNYKERLHWSVGIYRQQDAFGDANGQTDANQDRGDYNYTARLGGTPFYKDGGETLVYLGAAYSRRKPVNTTTRFLSRPRINTAPNYVDTGNISAEHIDQFGGEFAVVFNSLSIQAEAVYDVVDSRGGNRERFFAYYAYATYFLTGEHRNYKGSTAVFDKVEILKPFDLDKGHWGAFEVAFRYGHIDLDSGNVRGGKMDDFTVGLNWYFIPQTRLMINYVRANLQGVGESDALGLRFQIVF
jgi:phosphate-selective porin OprO and OprP